MPIAITVAITPERTTASPNTWTHRLKTTKFTRNPKAPTVPNFAASPASRWSREPMRRAPIVIVWLRWSAVCHIGRFLMLTSGLSRHRRDTAAPWVTHPDRSGGFPGGPPEPGPGGPVRTDTLVA